MSRSFPPIYEFGPFRLDAVERRLLREGEAVALTPKAFETLLALVENSGRAMEKGELMKRLWPDTTVEETTLAQNVSTLRRTLGEPTEGGQYIETLPKRGYRFVAPVREVRGEPAEPEVAPSAPAASAPPTRAKGGRTLLVGGLIAVVLAGSLYALFRSVMAERAAGQPRRLAILPFRNLKPDAEADFLSLSLAEAVIAKLGYVNTLVVRPLDYANKYRHQTIDPRQVAGELNVDTLLTGTYLRDGDDLRITPQLIDVQTGNVLWGQPLDFKYEKLITIQDTFAQEVIRGLHLKLTPAEAERLRRDAPRHVLAYEYYLRGVDLYFANDFQMGIRLLEESVKLDPNYALAWAHLGTAYNAFASFELGGREYYSKALAAYEQALALNPEQIEARTFLANTYTDTGRVEEAVPLLRDLLQVSSNNALARWELGYAYRHGGALPESIAECARARELDPRVKLTSSAFNSYLYAGEYDKFLASLPQMEEIAFITFYRGLAHYYLNHRAQAAVDFDRAYGQRPTSLFARVGKAMSYAIDGQSAQGVELLREPERRIEERDVKDPESIYKLAQAFAALGERAAALRLLRRSVEGGFFCYPYFTTDALLDNLRGEPEFGAILEVARRRHEEFKRRFF